MSDSTVISPSQPANHPQQEFLQNPKDQARSLPDAGHHDVHPDIADAAELLMASDNVSPPLPSQRSCITCRRRKVSCDNLMPCSRCKRAQVPCTLPPPGRAPRRRRDRDVNLTPQSGNENEAKLKERIRKLENIIDILGRQIDDASASSNQSQDPSHGPDHNSQQTSMRESNMQGNEGSRSVDSTPHDTSYGQGSSTDNEIGTLLRDSQKGISRYVSGFLKDLNESPEASDLIDIDNRSSDSDDPSNESSDPSCPLESQLAGWLALGNCSSHAAAKLPGPMDILPSHVAYLWLTYQENVEPLVKMLHVPSMHIMMKDARRDPSKLSSAQNALFLSICHSAVISLDDREAQENLGSSKQELTITYRSALERALIKAQFLSTFDISIMQALCLYLLTLRCHDSTQSCWTLTGLVIRIAQGMGMHRDGTRLHLTPLEVETRRRVWWAVMILDLRCAEETGSDLAIHGSMFDTRLPLSINDSAINASSTDPPVPVMGWSDCATALVRYETSNVFRQFKRSIFGKGPETSSLGLDDSNRLLDEAYRKLNEEILSHIADDAEPLCQFTATVARILMSKAFLAAYHNLAPDIQAKFPDYPLDQAYFTAVEIVECNLELNTEPRFKQYRWICATYFNWQPIACVLLRLIRCTWTAQAERGWQAVNGFERSPIEVAQSTDRLALFLPLRRLFLRAKRHRKAELTRLREDQGEVSRILLAERLSQAQSRFGPFPGLKDRTEEVRQHWISLVQPDDLLSQRIDSNPSFPRARPLEAARSDPGQFLPNKLGPNGRAESMRADQIPLPPLHSTSSSGSGFAASSYPVLDDHSNICTQGVNGAAHVRQQFQPNFGPESLEQPHQERPEQDLDENMWYDPFTSIDRRMEADSEIHASEENFDWRCGTWLEANDTGNFLESLNMQ